MIWTQKLFGFQPVILFQNFQAPEQRAYKWHFMCFGTCRMWQHLLVPNLSFPQLLAIIPCEISSKGRCGGVNQVEGEKEGPGPKANHQACQTIHNKAHLGLVTDLNATIPKAIAIPFCGAESRHKNHNNHHCHQETSHDACVLIWNTITIPQVPFTIKRRLTRW